MKKYLVLILTAVQIFLVCPTFAAPTTFPQVIGNALLCLDQIDPAYFRQYMTDFFQPAYKIEGEAYWFKAETTLFGSRVKEVFVSAENSKFAFLGVVMEDRQESAKNQIEAITGARFFAEQNPGMLRTPPGSFLIQYGSSNSKLFCVKHRIIDGVT